MLPYIHVEDRSAETVGPMTMRHKSPLNWRQSLSCWLVLH